MIALRNTPGGKGALRMCYDLLHVGGGPKVAYIV